MLAIHRLDHLRTTVAAWRDAGESVAFVPTMGALHEGHLTLVRAARERAGRVVVSIFVNPTQFGPNEDLDAYPRTLQADSELLAAEGVNALWAPDAGAMYPEGFATSIDVSGVSADFCGASRPGHFAGVATVVCKLFNQVQPDCALFGEKDWQQLAVIRRMARDLDLIRPRVDSIIGVPTVREDDGLALSSRNRYLDETARRQAAALPAAMRTAIAGIENGQPVAQALGTLETTLLTQGFSRVDYAALADADTLERIDAPGARPARLLVAAHIANTRLIDNMAVEPQS
ncbi:MAG: pantoate--beta-alanine ligase [Erythrobacter sp.]|nr:pantoate--beta-alanine ligase [Erythrobacter sp.]NCQ63220.1 pantoate--beta-alanine ligase [Alphaproteobacteria bacterium]